MRFLFFFLCLFFFIPSPAQWRVQSFGAGNGLHGFHFSQVFVDHGNRLWAVSSGGILRFDGQRFRNIASSAYGLHLSQLRDGSFVYTTSGNELHALRLKNNSWTDSLLARFPVVTGMTRAIHEDTSGTLWIGTSLQGVYRYDRGDTLADPVPGTFVTTSFLYARGNLYVGTEEGVYRLEKDSLIAAGFPFRDVLMGCTDHDGNKWVASSDTLLVMITPGGEIGKSINLHAFNDKVTITTAPLHDGKDGIFLGTSLGLMRYDMTTGSCSWPEWRDEHYHIMPHCAIYSLSLVSPGLVWCGTWRGLLRIQVETPGITSLPLELGENGTPYRLRSVAVVNADTLFGGSGNGSVYRFVRKAGSWSVEQFFSQPSTRSNAVNVLWHDRSGGLWIGRHSSLLRVDVKTRAVRTYPPTLVWAIHEDAGGCLWFSSNSGRMWRLPAGADSCEALPIDAKGPPWGIYNMYAENDVLLLATDHGIHYFDTKTLKTDSGHPEYAPLLRATADHCWSVCRDGEGRYYIGSQYDGLLRVDLRTGRTEKLTGKSVSVFSAVCDSSGRCWAITDKGLLLAGQEGQGPRFYDERDGLISSDLSFVGIRLMPGNAIVVAGENGLVITRTDELYTERKPLPLIIDHVDANGRLLAEDLRNGSVIRISYREQGINIHLCMPDARFPERYRYRYRINDDSTWSAWSENPVLSFGSFAPGSYRLLFEVQNLDGYYPGSTVLNIEVEPPFWETGFFYSGLAMFGMVLLVTGIRLRTRSLRRHYEMEQVLLESQNKTLRVQMNPHFIFNSLNSIQEFIIDHQSREANLYLGKFSLMMRQIIEYSRRSTITLQEEVDFLGLYLELEQLRFEDRFTFHFSVSDELEPEHARIPPMLVQPLVENAVKHGLAGIDRPGRVTISFAPHRGHLLCVVEDNGRGREKAGLHRREATPHESVGIGNITERLSILFRGKASQPFVTVTDLYDEAGNAAGTRVEILIPLT